MLFFNSKAFFAVCYMYCMRGRGYMEVFTFMKTNFPKKRSSLNFIRCVCYLNAASLNTEMAPFMEWQKSDKYFSIDSQCNVDCRQLDFIFVGTHLFVLFFFQLSDFLFLICTSKQLDWNVDIFTKYWLNQWTHAADMNIVGSKSNIHFWLKIIIFFQ